MSEYGHYMPDEKDKIYDREIMRKSLAADSYAYGINPTVTKRMMGQRNEDMSLNWYSTAPEVKVVSAFLNRKSKE